MTKSNDRSAHAAGPMEKVRISKLLSQQGLCSRREADSYIERGWVLVDGVAVTELGTRVYPNQRITLAPAAQSRQEASVTILLNKPVGLCVAANSSGLYIADTINNRVVLAQCSLSGGSNNFACPRACPACALAIPLQYR